MTNYHIDFIFAKFSMYLLLSFLFFGGSHSIWLCFLWTTDIVFDLFTDQQAAVFHLYGGIFMTIENLHCFVALAKELNFTKAAQRSHITQAAMSRKISSIEDELGIRLLDRNHQLYP